MRALDPVTLEVVWSRIQGVLDEVAATLKRTSFSNLVREGNDFCNVFLDRAGGAVAQSSLSAPSFLGTMPFTVQQSLRVYPPEGMAPGDILITNDPWVGAGHLLDMNVISPIFEDGELQGYMGTAAHTADVGGIGWTADASELYEEGLRIPVCKLYRRRVDPADPGQCAGP